MSVDDSGDSGEELVDQEEEKKPCCPGLPSAVSNFTIQFNFASASMATLFMKSHNDEPVSHDSPFTADFPQPAWVHTIMKSSVFIGSIAGMIFMGRLGDVLGIRKALIATNSLVVISAIMSGVFVFGEPNVLWGLLVFWRFLLGVGVGGNYPLSAAKASSHGTVQESVAKAGRAFFWQGPGSVAPYLVGCLLLRLPAHDGVTSLQFRVVMALGAVPAAAVVYFMFQEPDDEPGQKQKETVRSTQLEGLSNAQHDLSLRKTLVGTAGTWMFFDIAYYGTNIFAPTILSKIFEGEASLSTIAMRSAILPVCGIFGTLIGLPLLDVIGPRALNAGGLIIAAMLYLIFVGFYHYAPDQHNTLFVILCLVFFVLKGAPDIATYVLPVMSFPRGVRATYHGRSGSAGKIGAMLGTFIFPVVMDGAGLEAVFIVQAVACFISAACGIFLVRASNLDDEIETPGGRRTTIGAMDQDELEGLPMEDEVYFPEDVQHDHTIKAVEQVKQDVAVLNAKMDLVLSHLGVAGPKVTYGNGNGF
eukprot:CAMPEP_0197639738 /NCGR_PEP_ID=MMETSP1338-20131121/14266_1 /TAXON_ID=43686 ORGANISM="Pelagodinium beii, Strain RCC1491" /NCGR_SAMPLE_ID=MMETSP1338 /ASSEMBLY_ACC=CAM_ASM_000754 /LENGTH=529 /DNA_ID=CAMNT_0043212507 /DNA_START=44 /DNA_END=1633 /DNA_ORIENTATION=-